MSQRHQASPTVVDLVETSGLVQEAKKHADTWIHIPALRGELGIVVFHDAAWANAEEPDPEGAPMALWCARRATRTPSGVHAARTSGGPPTRLKARSQAGYLLFVVGSDVLRNGCGAAALVDWRSATIKRVCRSTFAAETMSAVDAFGAAMVLRASLLSLTHPGVDVANVDPRLCLIRAVTDCASLYDTIRKDGAVKLPSERRLVLDLIGLRELMEEEIQEHVQPSARACRCSGCRPCA